MPTEVPQILRVESLMIAFAGLTTNTRQLVVAELQRAINDTCVEYHRSFDNEIITMLLKELACLQALRDAVVEAQEEFDDITSQSSDGNSVEE